MPKRKAHCAWYRDNGRGRCIASCSIVIDSKYETDCIGNTGKSMDSPNHEEARVTCGFIDGRNTVLDSKGYKIRALPANPVDAPTPEAATAATTHTDTNGDTYQWAFMPNGKKYKSYITINPRQKVMP